MYDTMSYKLLSLSNFFYKHILPIKKKDISFMLINVFSKYLISIVIKIILLYTFDIMIFGYLLIFHRKKLSKKYLSFISLYYN